MRRQSDMNMRISRALHNESDSISASVELKRKIDEQLDTHEGQMNVVDIMHLAAHRKQEKTMKKINKINKMWVAAAVIAACILIPTGVYATGRITGYVSSLSLGYQYDSYAELAEAQEKAGFTFACIENFSNGYAFTSMDISGTDKMDESNKRFGTFKEWWGYYKKEGAPDIELIVHEVQAEAADYEPDAMAQKDINGITVSYKVDHYKNVPVDYEMTAEDEANMAGPHYYISVGTDEIEEDDISFTTWEQDGLDYSLMCRNAVMSEDDFFAMAEELIKQ